MRRVAPAALLLALGCGPSRTFDPVQVDIAANCSRAEAVVTYSALEGPSRPWTKFIAAAADAPGLRSLWALVEYESNGVPRLGLWHIVEDDVDARVSLEMPPNDADTLTLLPDATAGVAWLLRRKAGGFDIARVERNDEFGPIVVQSDDLSGFPPVSSSSVGCNEDGDGVADPCDARSWEKHLAIVDGNPFIVSVPTSSIDATTYAFVGRLGPSLELSEVSELQFTRQCDITAPLDELAYCTDLNERTSYPEIHVAAVQTDMTDRTWSLFLLRNTAIDGIPQPRELREPVVVTIGLQDNGSPQGVLRAQSPGTEELRAILGPPWGLAVDEFNTYLLHATARDGPQLVRVSNLEARFEDLLGLELTDDSRLVQLEGDVAVARVDGSSWRITKLFPDAPELSETTTFETSSPIQRTLPAGPGSFLVHEEDGGPTLISISCASSD